MDLQGGAGIWILVATAVVGLVWYFARPAQPPRRTFTCARCSTTTPHTDRTIEAWRKGTKRLFCDTCHQRWLSAQPRTNVPSPARASAAGPSRSGCLGISLVLVLVPLALVAFAMYA